MSPKKSKKRDCMTTDSDSSELEDISDLEQELKSDSNFVKYAVPQYDLKSKLRDMHYREINTLPVHEIGKLCHDILPELKKIQSGGLPSKRHEIVGDKDLTANHGEMIHYISLVLLPEALIRIYAKVNGLLYDTAENELRYGAGYDGQLPEELVRNLELKEKPKSPVKSVGYSLRERKEMVYQE